MATQETMLLRRFVEYRDSEAFSEIVKQYADSVYNTCRRILFDEAGAADAAQETFYQLMCNAGSIKGSLAGWLHSVATRQALNAIRHNAARRARERRYTSSRAKEVNQWKDISPYIDEELDKLPPLQRDLLIQYFFEGKKMTEIAAIQNVSQPTISRNFSAAIEELRKRFRKKGILVSGVILAALLEHNTLHAAPSILLTEVGKMSLVGTTSGVLTPLTASCSGTMAVSMGSGSLSAFSASTAKATVTAVLSTFKAKAATAIAIVAIGTGAVITYNKVSTPASDTASDVPTEAFAVTPRVADNILKQDVATNQPIVLSQISAGGGYGGGGFGGRVAGMAEGEEVPIHLTDPETTMETFTDLLVMDELDRWKDCFVTNSQELVRLNRIMTHPQNQAERQLQNAFNSIGHPVETLELLENENGLAIKLRYTVYDSFEIERNKEKHVWQEDDMFEIDAEVVSVDSKWKIASISTAYER